jgi:DNA topoisomerase VI subunit A
MGAPVLRARTTLQVLSLIHELSVDGAQTSLRDVYYRDPMLFESQRNSDEVISTFQPMVLRPVSVNSLLCRPSI